MARAVDNVFQMDRTKLVKLIVNGLVLAIIGFAIMLACKTIQSAATGTSGALVTALGNENSANFWSNLYGWAEYVERNAQITQSLNWMVVACLLLKAIGQIALVFGLLIALIGLLGSAINPQNDDKMRLVCMITGCVLIFVIFYNFISV